MPPSALSAPRSAMTRLRVDRRTVPSFGQELSWFPPQFFLVCPDRSKVTAVRGRICSRRSSYMPSTDNRKVIVVARVGDQQRSADETMSTLDVVPQGKAIPDPLERLIGNHVARPLLGD